MTIEQELKALQREFQQEQNEKVRLETRLEDAKKRRKEAHQKIKDKGHDPKDLPKIIKSKEDTLAKTIEEAKQYLPSEQDDDEDDFDYEQ